MSDPLSKTPPKRRNRYNQTIPDLYDRMIANGSKLAQASLDAGDSPTVTLSVRVPPSVRAYYEAQAKACGAAGASAMIAMVLHGVMMSTEGKSDQGLTFTQIGDLAYDLFSKYPTKIPAMSEVEAAALVGSLQAIWRVEWYKEFNGDGKE